MPKHKLNSAEIIQKLNSLNGWSLDSDANSISREWEFDSFHTTMQFFTKVGEIAENQNHHPEFLSTYTKMRLRLSTHDASGITQKDFDLATAIDQLIARDFADFC